MTLLASDLDRTLFPNGKQPDDGGIDRLKDLLATTELTLVYVTGRNRHQILEGMKAYNPPKPVYAIAEVGTRVYRFENGTFLDDPTYVRQIRDLTPGWDLVGFQHALKNVLNLRMQEAFNQNAFKQSYYVDDLAGAQKTVAEVRSAVESVCSHTTIVYSVDETINQGLLDILPRKANKEEGLAFVRGQLGVGLDDTIYCGDSGNDLLPLASGCSGVLVRNATESVRSTLRKMAEEKGILDKIYFARGSSGLNGYYASGIIEGLLHFGFRVT